MWSEILSRSFVKPGWRNLDAWHLLKPNEKLKEMDSEQQLNFVQQYSWLISSAFVSH